jgi:reactive intermediate/imine deaminase
MANRLIRNKKMTKEIIQTNKAPKAIGTYSQAVKIDRTVYLSGQIPLVPETMTIVDGDITAQITQVFENLKAVAAAAGGDLSDIVKLNVFLTDLSNFLLVNEIMGHYFQEPYPARAAIGVAALPKNVGVEMDGVMFLKLQEYPAS